MKTNHSYIFLFISAIAAFAQSNSYPWPASGNVGIGTTSPGLKTHILGDIGFPLLSGSVQTGVLRLQGAGSNGVLDFSVNGGSGAGLQVTNQSDLTQNYPLLLNPNGGNIGMGTKSPGLRAHIHGLIGFPSSSGSFQTGVLRLQGAGSNGVLDFCVNGGSGAGLQVTNQTDLSLNYPLLLNPNGGSVGIGTTNPAAKLEVTGTFRSTDEASQPLIGKGVEISYQTTSDRGRIIAYDHGTSTYKPLNLEASSYYFPTGNVGIGTVSPTERLSVNGRIRAKEVIVETNWADHVFASNYRLLSLPEVEQHIQKAGHLPGVPSAIEVAEKGVSVGDMQAVLLAKVEELTLHLIEQEKRIKSLERRNALLEAQRTK